MCKGNKGKKTGDPAVKDLIASPGFPKKFDHPGGIAYIECLEEIPCNPCETSCPRGAIRVGDPITSLPALTETLCSGCTRCAAVCPGLAITIRKYRHDDERSLITFPYEYLPLPQKGDTVDMVNRLGEVICSGEIVGLHNHRRNDRTVLVSAAFDRAWFIEVVSIKRLV